MDLGGAILETGDEYVELEFEYDDRATNLREEPNSSSSPASPIRFGSATPTDHLSMNHPAHYAMSDAPSPTPNAFGNTTAMTPVNGELLSLQQVVDLTESLRASPLSFLDETIKTSKDPSPPSVHIPKCQIIDHMHEGYTGSLLETRRLDQRSRHIKESFKGVKNPGGRMCKRSCYLHSTSRPSRQRYSSLYTQYQGYRANRMAVYSPKQCSKR